MSHEEMISLECPYCQNELYHPLEWFKEPDFSCPVCGKGLTAEVFSATIHALEEAMEICHAEMFKGEAPSACCCGGKGHCSGEQGL